MWREGQAFARQVAQVVAKTPPRTSLRYLAALAGHFPTILRRRSLGPADAGLDDVWLRKGGRRYDLAGVPFALVRELYLDEIYFLTPAWRPRPGDVIVDLGANLGSFSVLCAGLGAQVLAVEAQDAFRPQCAALARRNGVAERIDYRVGLLCQGFGVFQEPASREPGKGAIPAASPAIRVGALLRERGIETVDLVKADIEGAEFRLPEDEPELLRAARRLALEVHAVYGDPLALQAALRDFGFETLLHDKWGRPTTRAPQPVGFLYAWRR